jgi:hypothetical protein
MNYYEKYLKYKNKYINLKNNQLGGFIKLNTKNPIKEENYNDDIDIKDDYITLKTKNPPITPDNIKNIIDYYMPIPYLYDQHDKNFILINNKNYILIDYHQNDDFQLLQLTENYQIKIISKPHPILIKDNLLIENLDSPTKLHDIFESYYLFNENFFINLVQINFNDDQYKNFNKLRRLLFIIAKDDTEITKYRITLDNFLLKLIFMNKLSNIINILNNFDYILESDRKDYNSFKAGNSISFDEKEESLIDYIYLCKNKPIPELQRNIDAIIKILQNTINKLPKTIDKTDKNLILKIVSYVHNYINGNQNLIYEYNYACYIRQYNYHAHRKEDKKLKDMNSFINKNYNMIKQSLIFELVYILYILYKSNQEFTSEYKISQYLLMDYFIGSTRDQVPYLPINVRQTLVSIRNTSIDNGIDYKLPEEDTKYNIFKFSKKNFIYIPQTQITTQNPPYADCGERTLLNTFNYFLLEKDGSIHIRESWNERLKIFYGKWNNIHKISNQSTMQEMKNDWAKVIEDIPEFIYTNFYENQTYNIHPNLENIIKICKFLLNLKEDITIIDIIINLDEKVEKDNIIIYVDGAYDCIKYQDIVIQLNFDHSDFKNFLDLNKEIYLGNYINFFLNFSIIPDYKKTYEMCLFAVKKDAYMFEYVPYDKRTPEMCLLAVQKNADMFFYVPDNKKTPELCLLAVQKNVDMFGYIPDDKKTPELCLLVVQKNAYMIRNVPEDKKTPELCLLAVQKDPSMFKYIEDDKKTPEFCLKAFKRNINIFKVLDDSYKSPEMCLEAVKKNISMFLYVPNDKKSPELCLFAIKKSPRILKYLPEYKKTPELCLLAVQKDVEMFFYVPDDKKTPEICLLAVQGNVSMFQYVPDDKKTSEIYLLTVQGDASNFKYVPQDKKTPEMCLLAVQKNADMFEYVPDDKKTPEICLLAIQEYPVMFRLIPEDKKTAELCLLAVQGNVHMFEYVPYDKKTAEMCLLAVQKNAFMFEYVPDDKKTPEMCLLAVQEYPHMFQYVPDDKKTPEMCLLAVQGNVHMFQYVPDDKKTPEMSLLAVQKNTKMFQYVPDDKKTPEMCLLAVYRNAYMFNYVPEDKKTPDINKLYAKFNARYI